MRAIEVAGKQPVNTRCYELDALFIGLTAAYEILYRRIDERVEKRIKEGVEKEIKGLMDKGYNFENSVLGTTIGYQEWRLGKPREEIIQRWKFDEHNLARRQMTWFRKNKKINWFDINFKKWKNEVEELVRGWYTRVNGQKD